MTPTDVLRDAAELLSMPGTWTQGTLARDAALNEVRPLDPKAVSRCLFGAIHKAAGVDSLVGVAILAATAAQAVLWHRHAPRMLLASWNDAPKRTRQEVRGLLLEAAKIDLKQWGVRRDAAE
jgi:hypothetical protein